MRRTTGVPKERNHIGMEREDYLQIIHALEQKHGEARVSDLARILKVKKPSASQMGSRLERQGYLTHKSYGGLKLTRKGRQAAERVLQNRAAIAEFFTTIGVSKKSQEKDVHGMEHYLSPQNLKKLRAVTKFLREIKK